LKIHRSSLLFLLIFLIFPAQAQGSDAPLLAFLNSSGQLVVASADGATRWIVSNPGETLRPELGFSWSPDGTQIFYAVQQGNQQTSLRIGDATTQSIVEVGTVSGMVSGGEWVGDAVRVVSDDADALYSQDRIVQSSNSVAHLLTPFQVSEAYLARVSSFSANTDVAFAQRNGGYGLLSPNGDFSGLGIGNARAARRSGLWADDEPLVAYWGNTSETGDNALAVTNAETGSTITLTVSSSTPVQPILWLTDSTTLVYRDASSQLRAANVACLLDQCASNPLEAGIMFLPASANDVQQISDERVVFRAEEALYSLDPACLDEDACPENIVILLEQVAPRTFFDAVGSSIAITIYSDTATDPADRTALVLDTTCSEDCVPFAVPNAISGLLSPDEDYLVADVLGDGLYIVSVNEGSRVYLTGSGSRNDLLQTMRWNG